jgi:FtsH-binding integral membrane protein
MCGWQAWRHNPKPAGIAHGACSVRANPVSTATVLGQVMILVAVAIGFLALGSFIGRDLSGGVAWHSRWAASVCSSSRPSAVSGSPWWNAIGWLLAVALVVGLGLGPALAHYASADPPAITQAAGATALIVAAMDAGGLAFGNDLMAWYRQLTFALLGVILVSLVLVVFGSGGSAFVSLAIGGV